MGGGARDGKINVQHSQCGHQLQMIGQRGKTSGTRSLLCVCGCELLAMLLTDGGGGEAGGHKVLAAAPLRPCKGLQGLNKIQEGVAVTVQ